MVNKLRYDPLCYPIIGIQVLLSEHIEHFFLQRMQMHMVIQPSGANPIFNNHFLKIACKWDIRLFTLKIIAQ
jgi:hypothetical protein